VFSPAGLRRYKNYGKKTARNVHVVLNTSLSIYDDNDELQSVVNGRQWQARQATVHPQQLFTYDLQLRFRIGGDSQRDFKFRFGVGYDDYPTTGSVSTLLIGVLDNE
jgi:hypothetical protein